MSTIFSCLYQVPTIVEIYSQAMYSERMPSDLREILGDLVSVTHRLTRVAARAAGGSESPAIWRTLSVLLAAGPVRLGELAQLSRVSQPTATKLVTNLAERGWAERLVDPADARATQTAITSVGEAALSQWRSSLATAMLPLFADLTEADIEILQRAVVLVRERVDHTEGRPQL